MFEIPKFPVDLKKYPSLKLLGECQVCAEKGNKNIYIDNLVEQLKNYMKSRPKDSVPETYANLFNICSSLAKTTETISQPIYAIHQSELKSLPQIKEIPFTEGGFERALEVLHLTGNILLLNKHFFSENPIIILDPSWLNNLFTSVITIYPNKTEEIKNGLLIHSKPPNSLIEAMKQTNLKLEEFSNILYQFKIAFPVIDRHGSKASSTLIPSSNSFI